MEKHKRIEVLLTLVVASLVFYIIFKKEWLIWLGTSLGFIGLFIPFLSQVIASAWLRFAHVLGMINSKIILFIIFFFILLPVALMKRAFSRNDYILRKTDALTYYKTRSHKYLPRDFENVW